MLTTKIPRLDYDVRRRGKDNGKKILPPFISQYHGKAYELKLNKKESLLEFSGNTARACNGLDWDNEPVGCRLKMSLVAYDHVLPSGMREGLTRFIFKPSTQFLVWKLMQTYSHANDDAITYDAVKVQDDAMID